MGLFAKAAARKDTAPAKTKKQTQWLVDQGESAAVAKSVHELVTLAAQAKAIEAKMSVHKTVVKNFAEKSYLNDYAALGVPPETPMIVQNADGEKVTYVVQDRSGQYAVKDEQRDALVQLLGKDAAEDLLYTETSIGFSRDVMAIPGVSEAVEKALEATIGQLVEAGTLTAEQAELLIDVQVKTSFKPGTLDRVAVICGKNTTKMKQFLEAMGSSATRYVKV